MLDVGLLLSELFGWSTIKGHWCSLRDTHVKVCDTILWKETATIVDGCNS